MNDNELKETKISSESIYNGRLLHLYNDTVRLPDGNTTTREYIKHIGAVCIIAINDKNEVIIEKQFRYPFDSVITELPAGKLDSPDELPLDAAKREFREETGYIADSWTPLGEYYPTVAYSDETIYLFLAQGLHMDKQNLDSDEFLAVKTIPFSELLDDVMQGRIADGKTQTTVLKTARLLHI